MIRRIVAWITYRGIPYCFLYPFFKIFGRVVVKGSKNLPKKGGILLAANHLSYVDPPLLATMITRGCRFMAKRELFDIPVLKYIISYYAFPVDRQNPRPSSIKQALRELKEGKIVVIFPEGSRNATIIPLSPKNGIGMIAVLGKMKVVPTLIEGSDMLFPKGSIIPRLAKIRITFGEPIDVSSLGNDYENISRYIMDIINTNMGGQLTDQRVVPSTFETG